ncbi:hypothetical protein [Paenibacillus vini]|uniref:Uncharacterized protein n=1 Tax=Paenibacillus vini TaxID=1476024 RepID=A0ABQ4MGG0_9BACL|nr:hypothetical protein [Paenibacillus vini]GIP55043.1 hypothetical protein J42TS3_40780 [Paenibacillus vini]
MATQSNLEELVNLIEKALRPGPLARLLGEGSDSKELVDLLTELFKSDATIPSASISGKINTVLEILGGIDSSPFAAIARSNLNNQVLITTTVGTIKGVITEVGNWYAVLTEDENITVIVNFANTLAIESEGPEGEAK